MLLPIKEDHSSVLQLILKDTYIMATHKISPEKADANQEGKELCNLICSL